MILDLFKKKNAALDPASSAVLDQALVQRAKMDLVFEESVTAIKGLSCAVNTIGKESLVLDVYGISGLGSFSGKYFNCYFRVKEGKTVGFYGFRSMVEEVRQTKNGGIVFYASLPARVERSQRRRSMRVRPELGWFEEMFLWSGGQRARAETDEILLGLRELRQAKLCRMENMSAGGMGLHFDRQFCVQSEHRPSLGDKYTLYLRFAHEVRNQPRELWLSGKAVRVVEDRVTRDVDIGIEFKHVGRKKIDTNETLWQPIVDNVAEELITRVFEWHAALARERAAAE